MRRVVVTGMGIACPLGVGVPNVWKRLLDGQSGIRAIQSFDVPDSPAKVAGQVPPGIRAEGGLDLAEWIPSKDIKKMDRFIHLALVAAGEAVEDSGWTPETEEDRCATGVMIGSGIGGLHTIYEASILVHEGRGRRLSPFFIPASLINLASGHVSIRYGFKGPNHSVVTACATGVHAIGDAARLIMLGDAEVMVAGGAEAAVNPLGMAGFCASRALSTSFNDTPAAASRPWDRDRDGFVMGEGAGIVVLEEREHAKARGAKIYAEISGYGLSGDAHHITAPADGHEGAYRAMRNALRNGAVAPGDIQYVNAHGTSTPLGDDLELEAVERMFGDAAQGLAMSSTKSATGHLLGAAGAIEAVFSILAIRDNVAPPTLNLDNPSRSSVIDRVAREAQPRPIDVVLSNSFGFGGTNASILFRRAAWTHAARGGGGGIAAARRVGRRGLGVVGNWSAGPLPAPAAVVVPHGGLEQVAGALAAQGVIRGTVLFRVAAVVTRGDGPLHAAEFAFPAAASLRQVLDVLRTGRPVEHRVTLPEGLTALQMTALLARDDELDGPVVTPAEGSILPETYSFERGATREQILERGRLAMDRALRRAWTERGGGLPLASPAQALVLASLVERETARPEERAMVAGVFLNRLRLGMRLQSDPTVVYGASGGLGVLDHGITRAELERDDAYNTYRIDGLPGAPICMPGLASLRAATQPAATDMLYFVADGTGGHAFSRTQDEHLRHVARWRDLERRRAAAGKPD